MWLPGVHAPPTLEETDITIPSQGAVFTLRSLSPPVHKHLAGMGALVCPASGKVHGTRLKEETNTFRQNFNLRTNTHT